MGRLGPHAVPPPRTRQGVLKKRYTKKQGVKKKKVSTKKLGYVRRPFLRPVFWYTFFFSTPCLVLGGSTAWGPNLPI